jgi:hypothetical protein
LRGVGEGGDCGEHVDRNSHTWADIGKCSPRMIFVTSELMSLASKACLSVIISKTQHPNDHMSLAVPYAWLDMTSADSVQAQEHTQDADRSFTWDHSIHHSVRLVTTICRTMAHMAYVRTSQQEVYRSETTRFQNTSSTPKPQRVTRA